MKSDRAEIAHIMRRAGFGATPSELDELTAEKTYDDWTKARLRENTDELNARGGFGSPTIFVDGDDMYFGNDRLPLVAEALRPRG